jgi:hypothetical protein
MVVRRLMDMRAIRFEIDKRGRTVAYRWRGEHGTRCAPDTLGRWFRIGLEDARLQIATGAAYRYERPIAGATPEDLATN